MVFQKEGTAESGSESWNVAQGYTNLKILKPLVEMDKYVKIALRGHEEIEFALVMSPEQRTQARIEGIRALVECLRECDENSDFAMEKEGTKNKLKELAERVEVVAQFLDGISFEEFDARTGVRVLRINEEHFQNCLNELRSIKKEIPMPLNKNNLIFRGSDEVDLDKLAKQIEESG
jgi:uncharacterized protein YerC